MFACIFNVETYRVEEISHPFGEDKRHHDGNAEGDVSCTLHKDDGQTDGHSDSATQLTGGSNNNILGYIRALENNTKYV